MKGTQSLVLFAVKKLMRPLVRTMIHFEISYPVFIRMLKSLYVEVAEQEFQLDGKHNTDSRISLLTGVHRKDVRRFRENPETLEPPQPVSLASHVVSLWLGDPEYTDENNKPRLLPRLPAAQRDPAEGPGFEELVQSISKDVRPRALLDELLRTGVVRETDNNHLKLDQQAFVATDDLRQIAHYFGRNLRDHIACAGHNLQGDSPRFLERAVFYDRLSQGSIEELRSQAELLGNDALVTLNRMAVELAKKDEQQPRATQRMTFGAYFYNTPVEKIAKDDEDSCGKQGSS
ncbi:hypothetical protein BGP75_15315 [Motiliproteus sp. MSK22-1]|nr:hypothetical protein BGP75_15315 [Motiliproteus sp. MSK22-1]